MSTESYMVRGVRDIYREEREKRRERKIEEERKEER